MKKSLATAIIFLIPHFLFAQTDTSTRFTQAQPYEIIQSAKEKTLRGLISRDIIESDTTFKWFAENYKLGKPDAGSINILNKYKDTLRFLVFGGTWCEDTQNLLPQFYKLADEASISKENISLIGVDRKKTTLDNLDKAFHLQNVPTFIILVDGKEIGRMVEYGKSGRVDKDLSDIVNNYFK